jgi:RimJ/RimL family protein N-acetyltransferase
VHIQKDKIIIRNATADDAETLCNWWNDGKVMEHAGFPNGLGTTVEKIKNSIKNDSDQTYRRLVIEFESKLIGEMSFRNVGNATTEIGIKICDFSMQEKGLGTKILHLFITNLFNELSFEKIILDTNEKNNRAQQVYEKIGFKKVRVNKDS